MNVIRAAKHFPHSKISICINYGQDNVSFYPVDTFLCTKLLLSTSEASFTYFSVEISRWTLFNEHTLHIAKIGHRLNLPIAFNSQEKLAACTFFVFHHDETESFAVCAF